MFNFVIFLGNDKIGIHKKKRSIESTWETIKYTRLELHYHLVERFSQDADDFSELANSVSIDLNQNSAQSLASIDGITKNKYIDFDQLLSNSETADLDNLSTKVQAQIVDETPHSETSRILPKGFYLFKIYSSLFLQ